MGNGQAEIFIRNLGGDLVLKASNGRNSEYGGKEGKKMSFLINLVQGNCRYHTGCSFSGKFTPPTEDPSVQTRTAKATEHSQEKAVQL